MPVSMSRHIRETRKQRRWLGTVAEIIVKARIALDNVGPGGGCDKSGASAAFRIGWRASRQERFIVRMVLQQFIDTGARARSQTVVSNRANNAMSGDIPCAGGRSERKNCCPRGKESERAHRKLRA